jgi:hypothetical protein
LAVDLVNALDLVPALLTPAGSTGQLFATHLRRVFFGDHTTSRIGPPTLIVNTTKLDSAQRHIFFSISTEPQMIDSDLRTLPFYVAASGAFPVFFDPLDLGDQGVHIDGGVIENLGIEGLRNYAQRRGSKLPPPDIVIVSNFSAELRPMVDRKGRLSPWEVGVRAQDLVYARMHQLIFQRLTHDSLTLSGGPYSVSASDVWTGPPERTVQLFILGPRSRDGKWRFGECDKEEWCNTETRKRGSTLMYGVSELQTLAELSSDEARAAFWVGRKLMHSYLPDICKVLNKARVRHAQQAQVPLCRKVDLQAPPDVSPKLQRLADGVKLSN